MDIKFDVTYFFRHPNSTFHSIENVFDNIIKFLPQNIKVRRYVLKRPSKGIFNRLCILLSAFCNNGSINHITGDVSFIALALFGKRTIITFHDLESIERSSKFKTWVLKLLWIKLPVWKAVLVTAISEHTKNKIIEWTGCNSDKIKVIHNPLPASLEYYPVVFSLNKPKILVVGTKKNKNLEGIINAVKKIKCELIILGKLAANQLKLLRDNSIEYINYYNLSYESVIDLYKRCDILCFPSFYEGFGLPIIEAQMIGRPVITSNFGAMKEVAGNAALLVNPRESKEIMNAINNLINNEELRKNIVFKGLNNVKRFDARKIALKYTELYNDLASHEN